jgi:hypothetical protein
MRCWFAIALAGCHFTPGVLMSGEDDGGMIDDAPHDVAIDTPATVSCGVAGTTCDNDVLHECDGMTDRLTPCAWGCVAAATAHCAVLTPGVSPLASTDFDPNGLLPVDLSGTLNTSTGQIAGATNRAAGAGINAGIAYEVRSGVAIFRAARIHISSTLSLTGTVPVALVASGTIRVDATIDARGGCRTNGLFSQTAGPGGHNGGGPDTAAGGSGNGGAGTGNDQGGGGGGHGGDGGDAVTGGAGGSPFGAGPPIVFEGGGGGGGGHNDGSGGGGGGAVLLLSNTSIDVSGGINAGGCGGDPGSGSNGAGGGGGAGGAIVLEAPSIVIGGVLAVNGGGGGGNTADSPSSGAAGGLDRNQAAGGAVYAGAGGARNIRDGENAPLVDGGGGGAVGRIWIRTRTGLVTVTGMMSPSLTDNPTTASTAASTAN